MKNLLLTALLFVLLPAASFAGSVTGVTINGSGTKPDADATGDLWPMTWAADGNHYTAWGDGDGFNDTLLEKQAHGIAKVEGSPLTSITGTDLFGFDFDGDDGDAGKCNGGIIAVGSTLYTYVSEQASGFDFCKIGKSTDYGSTWVWGSGETTWGAAEELFNDASDGGAFAEPGIVQMGEGYDLNTDGYIYGIGDNDNNEPSDSMWLFRVPVTGMQTRANYEFFVSRNAHGDATWGTFAQKQPVVTDTGDINWGRTIVYHKWSDSYLMTLRNAAETAVNVWNAPNPWGPWTEISTINVVSDLGYSETLYSVNIVPGWFSSDGTSGYITASGTSAMDTFRYWAIDIAFDDGDTEDPFLAFSDLADGCNNCLTDDQVTSQGAIVTVWGNRLGDKKTPTREIYVGSDASGWVKPAHYYYWGNADSTSGGGPANLYESHKMQEISFALSSSTPTGTGSATFGIKIVTDGESSNIIPFTVRNTGSSYFISPSGGTLGGAAGTYLDPWDDSTLYDLGQDEAATYLSPGDTVYMLDGTVTGTKIWFDNRASANNTIGFIAYPGADVQFYNSASPSDDSFGGGGNADTDDRYVTLSKIWSRTDGCNDHIQQGRIVGIYLTDVNGAAGQCGGFTGSNKCGGTKYYGNHIEGYGSESVYDSKHHQTYFKVIGDNDSSPDTVSIPGHEFAWNYIQDGASRNSIHFYTQYEGGDVSTPTYWHHNVVINQTGPCWDNNAENFIGTYTPGYMTGTFYVYLNLCIGTGKAHPSARPSGDTGFGQSMYLGEGGNFGSHYWFNNTLYDYAYAACNDEVPHYQCAAMVGYEVTNVVDWQYKNNIVVDLHDRRFYDDTDGAGSYPDTGSNNIWFSKAATPTRPVPTWDASWVSQNSDPQLIDADSTISGNYTPAETSPAVDAGADLATIPGIASAPFYDRDLYGKQITTTAPDIGAIQYAAGEAVGDTDAPTVLLATVPAGGTTIVIEFNENVVTTGYATGDFNLDCTASGTDIDLSTPTGGGSGRTFTLVNAVKKDDTCNLDFAPAGADSIEDESGNDLANITDGTVTNNSTYEVINSVSGAVNLRIN